MDNFKVILIEFLRSSVFDNGFFFFFSRVFPPAKIDIQIIMCEPNAINYRTPPFISPTKALLRTFSSTQAGRNPLLSALRAERIFDHAVQ